MANECCRWCSGRCLKSSGLISQGLVLLFLCTWYLPVFSIPFFLAEPLLSSHQLSSSQGCSPRQNCKLPRLCSALVPRQPPVAPVLPGSEHPNQQGDHVCPRCSLALCQAQAAPHHPCPPPTTGKAHQPLHASARLQPVGTE